RHSQCCLKQPGKTTRKSWNASRRWRADNRILLSKYSGGSPWPRAQLGGNDAKFFYVDSFRIEIARQGRMYFDELELLAEPTGTNAVAGATLSAPLVFVSCGQSTPAERELG